MNDLNSSSANKVIEVRVESESNKEDYKENSSERRDLINNRNANNTNNQGKYKLEIIIIHTTTIY